MLTVLVLNCISISYYARLYHHLKLTFCWMWWLFIEIGFLGGLFRLWNCWLFFSFSLLFFVFKNRVGYGFDLAGLPSGKWTEYNLVQFRGSKCKLPLDISFTHLFLLISPFGNLCHMNEVTFEGTINLSGYLRWFSHVLTQHISFPILAHW